MIKHVLVSLLLLVSTTVMGAAPNLINYQGQLTDANGNALASDVYDLTFKIYDALTDGNLKWTETHTDIPVVKGFFNVVLGKNVDITPAFSTASAFLEITVDTGTPISPRQQVLSAPYAIQAGHATTADNADTVGGETKNSLVPVGSIIAIWGVPSADEGWLLCDGTAIPDDPKYDDLKAVVGSNVPDLRGIFIRGFDAGKGVDPNRTFASIQESDVGKHSHYITQASNSDPYGFSSGIGGATVNAEGPNAMISIYHYGGDNQYYTAADSDAYKAIDYGLGEETRPKNIALNYIIKY